MKPATRQVVSAALALCLVACAAPSAAAQEGRATLSQLHAARDHIKKSWRTLARSNRGLAAAAVDPKFKPSPSGRWPVYASRKESFAAVERALRAELPAADFARVEPRQLPENVSEVKEHGLLYLPRPYVVPGGRFNEMYGRDSYFIQVGLLRDGELELARDMADNFLYQIEHNVIVEKYDVSGRDSQVSSGLRFGYTSNEVGFGWTNAAFVELYAQLHVSQRERVRELDGPYRY